MGIGEEGFGARGRNPESAGKRARPTVHDGGRRREETGAAVHRPRRSNHKERALAQQERERMRA